MSKRVEVEGSQQRGSAGMKPRVSLGLTCVPFSAAEFILGARHAKFPLEAGQLLVGPVLHARFKCCTAAPGSGRQIPVATRVSQN